MTPFPIVLAHAVGPLQPDDLAGAWQFEPGVVVLLAISSLLYARGVRGEVRSRIACYWAGLATLALALLSPLHPLGEVLFSAHMAQHEILMLVAAPLLVWSRPSHALLRGLPFTARRYTGRFIVSPPVQRVWKAIAAPFSAWWIHAAALWLWHVPALFQATLRSEWVHTAQHLSFFVSALLFWWALLYAGSRAASGASVVYVFTTAIHTGVLGALLTFAPVVIYPAYVKTAPLWGLTPLEDQQIGGLIMWVPAGVVYTIAGLALFAWWLRRSAPFLAALACMVLLFSGCKPKPVAPSGGYAPKGAAAIARHGCGSCHTIGGIAGAHGLVGPPLTGLRDRMYVAGILQNTPENLVQWIRDPKAVNPKTAMPTLGLSQQDATDIAAYIYSIR